MSLSVLVVFMISCREKVEKKTFSEVKGFDTPVQGQQIKMPAMPPSSGVPEAATPAQKLGWTLPTGWTSHVGSGMYYAIFKTSEEPNADEGSVIVLPGEAGGLQANIERWAGQLGLSLPSQEMTSFISSQTQVKTKSNLDVTIVDFSSIAAKSGKSMLVGIVKPGEDSYFIKLTGPYANMTNAKPDFVKFCESLVVQ